jgi:hypothetical protein
MSRDEAPEEDLVSLGLKPVVTINFEKNLTALPTYVPSCWCVCENFLTYEEHNLFVHNFGGKIQLIERT